MAEVRRQRDSCGTLKHEAVCDKRDMGSGGDAVFVPVPERARIWCSAHGCRQGRQSSLTLRTSWSCCFLVITLLLLSSSLLPPTLAHPKTRHSSETHTKPHTEAYPKPQPRPHQPEAHARAHHHKNHHPGFHPGPSSRVPHLETLPRMSRERGHDSGNFTFGAYHLPDSEEDLKDLSQLRFQKDGIPANRGLPNRDNKPAKDLSDYGRAREYVQNRNSRPGDNSRVHKDLGDDRATEDFGYQSDDSGFYNKDPQNRDSRDAKDFNDPDKTRKDYRDSRTAKDIKEPGRARKNHHKHSRTAKDLSYQSDDSKAYRDHQHPSYRQQKENPTFPWSQHVTEASVELEDHVGDGLEWAEEPKEEEEEEGTDKDVVQQFLEQVEKYEKNKANCTAGTAHNLGKGVIKQYGLNRFKAPALVAVNRANFLSRIWMEGNPEIISSEYFFFTQVRSMVEGDPEIFAAGNCYDKEEFKDYYLFCPYAYRTGDGEINVKDLSVEYDYLGNSSEWFYTARLHTADLRNFSFAQVHRVCDRSPELSSVHRVCDRYPELSSVHRVCDRSPELSSVHRVCDRSPELSSGLTALLCLLCSGQPVTGPVR
ncbi:hypothetical protein ACOMHN_041170 [Nucella lapillus]